MDLKAGEETEDGSRGWRRMKRYYIHNVDESCVFVGLGEGTVD